MLLASGRDADVYAVGDDRVLRRYRDGADVAREVEVMRHLGRLGYPVPWVHSASGPEMVMERVYGPTMLQVLMARQLGPAEGGKVLADLHNRLHALPAVRSTDPAHTVVHLDLHPDNVILTDDGPIVIDWRTGGDGPAGLDCALTGVIVAQAAVLMPDIRRLATQLIWSFLDTVAHPIGAHLDDALARRAANPTLTADEVAALGEARVLLNAG